MTHYQEVRRENVERRLALGGVGRTYEDATRSPFCGASRYEGNYDDEVDMTPLVSMVDCPGCKALLLLRRLVQARVDGADTYEVNEIEVEARLLLVSLGDAV